jgi:2-phosphosulfolactate phosphatase
MSVYDQEEYEIRFAWGQTGAETLAPVCDVMVIVDVLSFSTCVSVAVARGATVYPYRFRDASAVAFAQAVDAILAGSRGKSQFSLSPESLMSLDVGSRIVLPSPNGSTISFSTGDAPTYAGCLRNAGAVAAAAMRTAENTTTENTTEKSKRGSRIGVIACGERWKSGGLRPALEDMIGAGAIIARLHGSCSPEAAAAASVFKSVESTLTDSLIRCSSGKELIAGGYMNDVTLAAAEDADTVTPLLINGAYTAAR